MILDENCNVVFGLGFNCYSTHETLESILSQEKKVKLNWREVTICASLLIFVLYFCQKKNV